MQLALSRWFGRARHPRGPVTEAERHCAPLIWSRSEHVPGVGAGDRSTAANASPRWLDDRPCPNAIVGAHLMGQIVAAVATADTVRTTITELGHGHLVVARRGPLRDVVPES